MAYQKTIAVITARGGSKRLPGKNILPLNGIPLIVHSILYAKSNKHIIDKIIVSTDDEFVKELAFKEGVEVVERPASLSDDNATTVSALKHVLEIITEEVENLILLQPTNPLRPANLLTEAFLKYETGNFKSLMTVTRSYQKVGKIENQRFVPLNYTPGQRSQDLDPIYYENGLLYISKSSLILQGKILGEDNFPFIVDHPFAEVDIDYKEDLEYAEFLIRRGKNKN